MGKRIPERVRDYRCCAAGHGLGDCDAPVEFVSQDRVGSSWFSCARHQFESDHAEKPITSIPIEYWFRMYDLLEDDGSDEVERLGAVVAELLEDPDA